MKKITASIYLMLSFFCIVLSGCTEKTNENRILYVNNENYTAIQDAINAANENDIIMVSPGIYYEVITIENSITLIAQEPGNTIITFTQGQHNHSAFIQIKANNCTIDGFTIRGDYPLSDAPGIVIFGSNTTIANNNISSTFQGIYLQRNIKKTIISSNIITNSKYGLYLNDCYHNTIFLNTFFNNNWGIRLKGAGSNEIYKNQVFNNIEGLYCCCGAMNNIIYNNNFINNSENAYDDFGSDWYKNIVGNYWSDYAIKYPDAQPQDTFWSIPYRIPGGDYQDQYPLIEPFLS